jgi:hypothetical protein
MVKVITYKLERYPVLRWGCVQSWFYYREKEVIELPRVFAEDENFKACLNLIDDAFVRERNQVERFMARLKYQEHFNETVYSDGSFWLKLQTPWTYGKRTEAI